jgi:adenylate cyclase
MTPRAYEGLPLRIIAASLAIGLLWTGWLGWRHLDARGGVLDRAEATFSDQRLLIAGPRPAPRDIVIVAIDDDTVAAAGGYPLDRRTLADLVAAIREAGARALAIDLLLVDAGVAEDDRYLARMLGSLPTVIAGAGRFAEAGHTAAGLPRAIGTLAPLPVFAEAARVGLVNVATDASGTPRHLPMIILTADGPQPSFVLRAASLLAGVDPVMTREGVRLGPTERVLDMGWHLPIRFLGPRGTVETLGAGALLAADPAVAARLGGKLVVLGATATAVGDTFGTAFDRVLPGVEVLATGIANLAEGPGLARDTSMRRVDVAAALALTLAGILAVSIVPLTSGLVVAATLLGLWLAATTVLFAQGWWLSAALPIAATVPAIGLAVLLRQMSDRRRAKTLAAGREALRQFQPPALAGRIAGDPAFLREPMELEVATLFVDLSGFTGLSEKIGHVRTREFLKTFHTIVVDEAAARDGVVMNFMGDGAMIVFGIPEPAPDDASHAMEASYALVRATRQWIRDIGMEAEIPRVRVGAHFGPVSLSRLGHEAHQQIAATGDSVNLASRLMEVGKEHGASIVASSRLLSRIETLSLPPDSVRTVEIRGRTQPIEVALWTMDGDAQGGVARTAAR